MAESKLRDQSLAFAVSIINLVKELRVKCAFGTRSALRA